MGVAHEPRPRHPYTQALIRAVPHLAPRRVRQLQDAPTILDIRGLTKIYGSRSRLFARSRPGVLAVKDATIQVRQGETLGIVGESGSGKSTVARCIVRLVDADTGEILLDGADLRPLSRRQLRPYRRKVQIVFQDPFGSRTRG